MARIKYVGAVRPGVVTSSGLSFEYDKPVEVPDGLARILIEQGGFRPVDNRGKR